ncbi:MAG: hypothetical protein D6746_07140 [Bacteroidetes bacterium]|nr:MAG: hypothetical protein D6746_07140 [Bacteroidota bacterium]
MKRYRIQKKGEAYDFDVNEKATLRDVIFQACELITDGRSFPRDDGIYDESGFRMVAFPVFDLPVVIAEEPIGDHWVLTVAPE